jgi:hypothetical protein
MVPLRGRTDKAVDLEILNFLEPGLLGVDGSQSYSFVAEGIIKPVRLLKSESIVYPEITGENRDYMGEFSRNSIEQRCWLDGLRLSSSLSRCFMLYVCPIKGTR